LGPREEKIIACLIFLAPEPLTFSVPIFSCETIRILFCSFILNNEKKIGNAWENVKC
jgi:hypothetical protein